MGVKFDMVTLTSFVFCVAAVQVSNNTLLYKIFLLWTNAIQYYTYIQS